MPRRGENIYKRKDGRWEGRYIRGRTPAGKAEYGYVYAKSYAACREKRRRMEDALPQKPMLLMHFPTNLCHAGICSMAFLINLEL